MIAHATHPYDSFPRLARNHELSVLIGHTTRDETGVSDIEQGNVGEIHRATMRINDASHHLGRSLLRAFHEDVLSVYRHFYRIEADDLLDGIGSRSLHDIRGDGEVLQLIIYEVDAIILRALGEEGEGFRHRGVAEVMSDALGVNLLKRKDGQDGYQSNQRP